VPNVTPEFIGSFQFLGQTGLMSTTTDTLTNLHDHYVEAVNMAVAADDDALVSRLAAEFDVEALDVVRRRLAAA
jgi:hypothetical protein